MSGYLVAIDGGGTKTQYLLAADTGEVLKQVAHAQTNLTVAGLGMAAFNLREGLRQLLEDFPPDEIGVMVLALAGLDNKTERQAAHELFQKSLNTWKIKKLVLLNDTAAALVNGTRAPQSIILVGGTGSNCLGHDGQGRHLAVGGLGHLLSDEGSGYEAGRLALKAAVSSADGRTSKSRLEAKIFTHFGVNSLRDLKQKVYNPDLNKGEIASLGKMVADTMREGDEAAAKIITTCMDELLGYVKAVAQGLDFSGEFNLVLSGSFLLHLQDKFTPGFTAAFPQGQIIVPQHPPVYGALTIAQEIYSGAKPAAYWYF